MPKTIRLTTDYNFMDKVYKEGTIFTRDKEGFYRSKKYSGRFLSNIFAHNPEVWEASVSEEYLATLKRMEKRIKTLEKAMEVIITTCNKLVEINESLRDTIEYVLKILKIKLR